MNELTAIPQTAIPQNGTCTQEMVLSPSSIREQVNLIQKVMIDVMKNGEHYGVIPGCGTKKVLLKAGAEKLSLTFKLSSHFRIDVSELQNGHREYMVTTTITHIPTGLVYGEGVGSCSTMESKFRYRNATLACPSCSKSSIIKGKEEYGGGYVCYKAKGGCGAKFSSTDERIIGQQIGKTENDNIADTYNTVLKIAKKRSQVDAVLTVTAASDIFTQDLEEDGLVTDEQQAKNTDNVTAIIPLVENKAKEKKEQSHNLIDVKNSIVEQLKKQDTMEKLEVFYKKNIGYIKKALDKDFQKEFNETVKAMKLEIERGFVPTKMTDDVPQ